MADVEQILRAYGLRLKKNLRLSDLYKHAKDYMDAMTYAKGAGKELALTLSSLGGLDELSEDELVAVLDACLKAEFKNVSAVCNRAQRGVIQKAGLNIGTLASEYSPEAARTIAATLIDSETISYENVKNLIIKEALGVVDNTIQKNADANTGMGLTCRITRTYDDIGLHDGKDPCQWCLDREGEWDNYQDALAAGAFNRHPGCGCVITYEVGRTRTWSNSAGVWYDM